MSINWRCYYSQKHLYYSARDTFWPSELGDHFKLIGGITVKILCRLTDQGLVLFGQKRERVWKEARREFAGWLVVGMPFFPCRWHGVRLWAGNRGPAATGAARTRQCSSQRRGRETGRERDFREQQAVMERGDHSETSVFKQGSFFKPIA